MQKSLLWALGAAVFVFSVSKAATAPLDLVIGNYKTLSVFDVRTLEWFVVAFVSDDGDVLIVLHFITVCPISVTLAPARAGWVVRLLQFTEPLSDQLINVIPLTKVTCRWLYDRPISTNASPASLRRSASAI